MNRYFTLSVFIILWSVFALAGIVRVPQDQLTIQAGIDAAVSGDTVLAADNIYYENISFRGKAITVASNYIMDGDTNHINNTVIDGSWPSNPDSGSVVYFISGEDTNSVLTGFTITGGTGTSLRLFPHWSRGIMGGGILIVWSGAKIEKNKIINNNITASTPSDSGANGSAIAAYGEVGDYLLIRDNLISGNTATADGLGFGAVNWGMREACVFERNVVSANIINADNAHGGGLILFGQEGWQGAYIVRNNIIKNNTVNATLGLGFGGGLYIQNCSPKVTNNIISGNSSRNGGGVSVRQVTTQTGIPKPVFINNTITNNNATDYGGGFEIVGSSQTVDTVMNTILWGNSANIAGSQIDVYGGASIWVNYSDVQDTIWPGTGNINADPQFENTTHFYLANGSPCIDTGDPAIFDPEDPLNPGFALFPAMGTLHSDMGAYGGPGSRKLIVGIKELPSSLENLPNDFILAQNYPNPFNPTTNIEFAIPKSEFVTLKVYNILGEEVATLVSEQLAAGSYKYDWDASSLASGVYLYRIQAGEYFDMKKMILLR